ncbi:MAG: DUF4270 domain-containing protein, partial [Saprospiraceae bacterium]
DPNETILQTELEVKTFSVPVNPVQTNVFSSFLLGDYEDPIYGRSNYGIVTQVVPSFLNPDFSGTDENQTPPVLKSAFLEIPYYSTATGIADDGESTTYEIDSLYGIGALNLKIYRNKYFINEFDVNDLTQPAAYYSDEKALIEAASLGANEELIFSSSAYSIENEEIQIEEDGVITERKSPRIRIDLLNTGLPYDEQQYWSDILLNSDPQNYQSASNFKNFFRGLYITAENDPSRPPVLVYLDLLDANITFSIDVSIANSEEPLSSAFRFDFGSSTTGSSRQINFIEHEIPMDVQTDIENSFDEVNGTENIYIKGGGTAIGFIDLFGADNDGDGEADALTEIIENQWLINDAILEFQVNQDVVEGGTSEPERIIVYNAETRIPLADYDFASQLPGLNSNLTHLGRLERVDNDDLSSDGVRYRVRITDHLNGIINGLFDNDRLVIEVSQNVDLPGNALIRNQTSPIEIESVTLGGATSHEGTVLHGSQSSDISKRPKLTVYYSVPD